MNRKKDSYDVSTAKQVNDSIAGPLDRVDVLEKFPFFHTYGGIFLERDQCLSVFREGSSVAVES